MIKEPLKDIARVLDEAGIAYMVIGGQAVLRHGRFRVTHDIDVTVALGVDRIGDLLAVSERLDIEPEPTIGDPLAFAQQCLFLRCRHRQSPVGVDLAFTNSPYQIQAIDRAHRIDHDGQVVCIASPEDLIIAKIIAGRAVDIDDINQCFTNKQPSIAITSAAGLSSLRPSSKRRSCPFSSNYWPRPAIDADRFANMVILNGYCADLHGPALLYLTSRRRATMMIVSTAGHPGLT